LTTPTTTRTLSYQDSSHVHAATHINGVQKYWYAAAAALTGNLTKRIIGSDTYDLAYDPENRLIQVKKNSFVMATFTDNGDGQRVKQTLTGATTTFVGRYYEMSSTTSLGPKVQYTGATIKVAPVRFCNRHHFVYCQKWPVKSSRAVPCP
jgi:hypothetical protein